MTYPRAFLRLVASGSLFQHEQWSFGLSLVDFDDDNVPDNVPTAVPPAIVSALSAYIGDETISAGVTLDTIKLNLIGQDGRYVSQTGTVQHDLAAGSVKGANTSVRFPPQIALAVTLNTDARRGLASRGRFYVPGPAQPIGTDGLLPAGAAEVFRNKAVTLLDAVNRAVPGYEVCVASDVGSGAFRRVQSVRVGRVLDTMRSRRGKFAEAYTPNALVTAG